MLRHLLDFIVVVVVYTCVAAFAFALFAPRKGHTNFTLFDQKEVSIKAREFFANGYDPLMPPGSDLKHGVDLRLKTDIIEYFYWNNTVWSLWDQNAVRWVGWNYTTGVRLSPFIDLEYEHFSKHIQDREFQYKSMGKYPVEDSVNVIFYLYRDKAGGPSVFN